MVSTDDMGHRVHRPRPRSGCVVPHPAGPWVRPVEATVLLLVDLLLVALLVAVACGDGGVGTDVGRAPVVEVAWRLDGTAPPAAPPGAGVAAPGARYAWPLLPRPAVLTAFGAPTNPYAAGHRGVDLAGVVGQPVLAARAGTVVFAGAVAGRGVVAVDHDDGLRTTYEPLTPLVVGGQVVPAGAVLGLLVAGHPGCAQVCLHWGVRRDRLTYLDPLVLLAPWRVRLLPWGTPPPDPGDGG